MKTYTAIMMTFFCLVPYSVFAHYNNAYTHSGGVKYKDGGEWMKKIPGSRRLSHISIPGTHDTMSRYGGDLPQTQSMSLHDQLESGVRYIDIRLRLKNNTLKVYHGITYQKATFKTGVLKVLVQWLKKRPSETVIMKVKKEGSNLGKNTKTFKQVFEADINAVKTYIWQGYKTTDNPTLDKVRKKIIIVGIGDTKPYGMDQDKWVKATQWKMKTNHDLYNRWNQVKRGLRAAQESKLKTTHANHNKIHLTGLNGAGDGRIVYPYFVSSGHTNHSSHASRLATGRTTAFYPNSYPDFPRKSGSILFEGLNILTASRLASDKWSKLVSEYGGNKSSFQYVGIVMMDFPGEGLLKRIIEVNFRNNSKKTSLAKILKKKLSKTTTK